MTIKRRTILFSLFYIGIFALAASSCIVMYGQEGDSGDSRLSQISIGMVFVAWFILALRPFRKGYKFEKPSFTIRIWNIFFIWGACVTLFIGNTTDISIKDTIYKQVFIYLPLLIINVTYYFILHNGIRKELYYILAVMCGMFLFTYYSFYDVDNILLNIHLGSSYYSLYALPLVMIFPSKIVKICGLFLVSIAIFSSVKRGGVMALLVSVFVYIIVKQLISPKGKVQKIIIGLSLLLIITSIFIYIGTMGDNDIFERFENLDKDNGSGRTDVWEETWRLISNQNPISFLIGNGYDTVQRDSRFTLSAHNDFLETWYDYGFIGFLLYTTSILSLCIRVIKSIKNKEKYAAEFAMSLTIVFILTNISHIQLYFWINIVVLNFALFTGYSEHEKRLKQEKEYGDN